MPRRKRNGYGRLTKKKNKLKNNPGSIVYTRNKRKKSLGLLLNVEELKLLKKGFTPSETKHGFPFKGRNRVIIA